ncbi:MAG: alpha/beta hydrolase-fold protein [Propionibacteriaceae bacterium]|nr:alpha/beta hydrolase-fold protein [Propionibacteriaceae bacterium]
MTLDNPINRRHLFKGAGGVAAAAAIGIGSAVASAPKAHASGLRVIRDETFGRLRYYRVVSPSINWGDSGPGIFVLLPTGYTTNRRYPVLYLFHGGGARDGEADFRWFWRHTDIENITAGKDLIVVMPDGGKAGWYSNPVTSNVGARNWEHFHINELIPWVDATFSTYPEYAGRAVSGFSMGGFGALKYAAKYYGHFASVSSHSGPASLRRDFGLVTHWANLSSAAVELGGGTVYGVPWDHRRVSMDNPVERIESYRHKRIFLVAGTDSLQNDLSFGAANEAQVLAGQREFSAALHAAGIPHERYEEPGGHLVRDHRLRHDIDGIIAHLRRAG